MSFIARIEGPGETQDLPEIKKISLSKSEFNAELINKIEELQDIEDSILVVDEAKNSLPMECGQKNGTDFGKDIRKRKGRESLLPLPLDFIATITDENGRVWREKD